jgi:hypothetical protein
MTHRERHIPDEATPHADRAGHGSKHAPPSNGSLWDDWYPRASPTQQQEALRQAVQQGVLYAHQLAAPAHTIASNRSLLSTLLNGSVHELAPLNPPSLTYSDGELDDTQREAVARAVSTPDVCLIQGFPGTGKSRLIAEIILQAAVRGERIVFLAPSAAAVDGVLERLGTHAAVCPIRCLVADENLASLSPAVARLTLPERLRAHQETTVPAARSARDAARQALDSRLREQSLWPQLEQRIGQCEHLAEHLRTLQETHARLEGEELPWEQASDDIRARWQASERTRTETLERLEGQLAGLVAELETTASKQIHLENEWQAIRPLMESKKGGRFWTASWWRAVLHGGLNERVRDLAARRADMQATRQRLEQDIAARRGERNEIENRFAAECRLLREEEASRRRTELDAAIAVVTRQFDAVREQARMLCRSLPPDVAPAEMSRSALQTAHAAWQRLHQEQARKAESAEQWLRTIEDGARTLPRKLADCANVVAATTAALAADAHFGDRNGTPAMLFDLLILEEAHQVTESEFAAAARRARRWILIGEPRSELESTATPRKVVRTGVPRPSFFERLWHNLHADPRRLPVSWMRREGRLHCRLRSFSPSEEKWIESEPVVDRPDIELRILSIPHQTPRIVEVLFPAGMELDEAKRFLFQESEELAVQTHGHSLRWSETATEVILELADRNDAEATTLHLAHGVRECIARLPANRGAMDGIDRHTCSLSFAVADGWTRTRAETWIEERLGLRSLGRTVRLTASHRLDPPLACFVSDLLFNGQMRPAKTVANSAWPRSAVEFVAVPPLTVAEKPHFSEQSRPRHGETAVSMRAPRLSSVKGGAGLELDLADHRPLEQLPPDLRSLLPPRGLVNYLEALALVKRLEMLPDEEDFRSACAEWRQRRLSPCELGCVSPTACTCPHPPRGPIVAVMALYPAQVELLRHLLRRSASLSVSEVSVEVGPPSAFAQRECLLALLSLTRSHTHRAVSYGEHPFVLAQALTRAASGLILFGDPGTLARRSQWRGPLDHLDDEAARREARLAAQLVQYLQGRGPHPSVFRVQEGSSV